MLPFLISSPGASGNPIGQIPGLPALAACRAWPHAPAQPWPQPSSLRRCLLRRPVSSTPPSTGPQAPGPEALRVLWCTTGLHVTLRPSLSVVCGVTIVLLVPGPQTRAEQSQDSPCRTSGRRLGPGWEDAGDLRCADSEAQAHGFQCACPPLPDAE